MKWHREGEACSSLREGHGVDGLRLDSGASSIKSINDQITPSSVGLSRIGVGELSVLIL
jgi:hypothetical protein